jgi:riboflavin kinase/FMN adenylyltransferase
MTGAPTLTTLRDERGVVTCTVEDASTRNALSLELLRDIDETLRRLADDPAVRVIVFTGAGTTFSSGANRAELGDSSIVERTTELLSRILEQIDRSPVPLVCRVNGAAFGAGLAIVATADLSVAVATAQFALPEVRFGLVGGPAAAACVRRMGETAALDLFLTGRRFDAMEAERLHLVTRTVKAEELDAATEAVVTDLLLGDPRALAAGKEVVRALCAQSLTDGLAIAREISKRATEVHPGAPRLRALARRGVRDIDWRDVPSLPRSRYSTSDLRPDLLEPLPEIGTCVVTVGTFDGMHLGHAEIIRRTVASARRLGIPSVLLTFDPHPAELIRPGFHPAVLTTIARRAEIAAELGIDYFRVVSFDLEYSQMSPDEFVYRTMVERLQAAEVVVGENFTFGHRAAGTAQTLADLARTFGFQAQSVELVCDGDTVVSSTYVRSSVEAGAVGRAQSALGRAHRLDGVVEHGDHRGRQLGFPTANVGVDRFAAVPADGVYAGRVLLLDEWGQTTGEALGTAALSVGTNPTFDGRQRRIEAHILDFDSDLYGRHIGVEFDHRLRGMVRFTEIDALVEQMKDDVERTRQTGGS